MSSHESVTISCPECGQEQSVLVWNSLNAQLSPEAKADFFEGKINVLECKSCHAQATLSAPFMYHDMALKFCVQYYPLEFLEDEDLLKNLRPRGSNIGHFREDDLEEDVSEEAEYLFYPHIVFSMQEALAYVAFRDMLAAVHQRDVR